jgi:predicted ATPase
MATEGKRIFVETIEFSAPAFRQLSNIRIELGKRFTLIAGHNGIGKSTILGLLSNTFGLTTSEYKSYIGEPFYANIERIVYLALDEADKAKEHPSSAPVVTANIFGERIRKRCALTKRNIYKRARVVPRTIDSADSDVVGQDAKVPLPTIYLGIRRLASIGEAEEKEVDVRSLVMHDDDRALMTAFVRSVIIGSRLTSDVSLQSIKGARKRTAQPGYEKHDGLAVSMGQDSLSSIATALASFSQLKRQMGDDYPGGLLVIDELDVGFHPHAITRMAEQLKRAARQLNLQIVATTHSPVLISAIHPENSKGGPRAPDSVIYLLDTASPRMAPDQSLSAILNDMSQTIEAAAPKARKPVLCAYFEDGEAVQFCEELIPTAERREIAKRFGITLRLIGLGVGGSSLVGLPDKDPLFSERILIADGDTPIPQKAAARGNTIKLPCVAGSSGTQRSPENTVKAFVRRMITETEGPAHEALLRLSTPNPSTTKLLTHFFDESTSDSDHRDSTKAWWVASFPTLKRWGVIREWSICYPSEAAAFREAFEGAIRNVSEKVLAKSALAR